MKESILIGLLQNIAILFSFSMLYEYVWLKNEQRKKMFGKTTIGFFIGIIGIVLIFTPWTLMPGIAFDMRSVLLSISGLFLGPIPTIIAMLLTTSMRIYLGGSGIYMGVAVILMSGSIGILWGHFRPYWMEKKYILELILLGLLVHISMLGCTIFLPAHSLKQTLYTIAVPLLLIYTPATLLLGLIMLKQANNWQNKLAKEKLKSIEIQFNSIMKSGNIASVILNNNFNITFSNSYFIEKLKYEYVEIVGKNWLDIFVSPTDTNLYLEKFNQANSNQVNNFQIELPIMRKDGVKLFFAWHISVLYNRKNDIEALACIGVDITERIHYENTLKENNIEIEARNTLYKQLNEELHQAKEKAEESDRLKSAFLANLSHEIRTPMNAIMGFSELLISDDLSSDKRESFISIIQNRGQHLLTIINDIVEMSKIDTGQIKPNNSHINIELFIDSLYNSTKISLNTDLNIKFSLLKPSAKTSITLYTDETKLSQILSNFLVNAFKFTKKGEVKLGYTFCDNEFIEFFIEDTGIGIAKKYHEVIFERFRQVDENSKVFNAGSGLGLAISKAYTDLIGGSISMTSAEGTGSVFRIKLPLNISEKEDYTNINNEELG